MVLEREILRVVGRRWGGGVTGVCGGSGASGCELRPQDTKYGEGDTSPEGAWLGCLGGARILVYGVKPWDGGC